MTKRPETAVLSQLLAGLLELERGAAAVRKALAAYCDVTESHGGKPYIQARKLTYELEALLEAAIEDMERRGVKK